jgi:hypothetical protein
MQNYLLKRHISIDPDLKKRDFNQDKKIENLYNMIRPVGESSHYVQQACISNLLVTVFAFRPQDSLLIQKTFHPLFSNASSRPRA